MLLCLGQVTKKAFRILSIALVHFKLDFGQREVGSNIRRERFKQLFSLSRVLGSSEEGV